MPKIFISYRRADSQAITDRLYDHMGRHFGAENVFQDVNDMPFGVDFPEYLSTEINKCDVVLVIIGKAWEHIMQERANQTDDFVRIEVESALQLNKLVIPVLVNGAEMPPINSLPPSIQEICRKNAAEVRHNPDFNNDFQRLVAHIEKELGKNAIHESSPLKASLDLLPAPFEWITINCTPEQVPLRPRFLSSLNLYPARQLSRPTETYNISKYPITNAQFAKFVEAQGYKQQKWWTDTGWEYREKNKWTQPHFWKNTKWNRAECPVVGISRHEALAFCQWLSHTTKEQITLPTEEQWQYAAQGDDARDYPWGNEWDGKLCNNSIKPHTSDRTSPVNQYEGKDQSPFGVIDMAGNVQEWTLSGYHTDGIDENEDKPVIRGGAWDKHDPSEINNFRCNYRLFKPVDHRSQTIGFRIVRND